MLDRKRHERQIGPVKPPRPWKFLQKRRMHLLAKQKSPLGIRQKIHETVKVGVRDQPQDLTQHTLRASHFGKPVVYHGDALGELRTKRHRHFRHGVGCALHCAAGIASSFLGVTASANPRVRGVVGLPPNGRHSSSIQAQRLRL